MVTSSVGLKERVANRPKLSVGGPMDEGRTSTPCPIVAALRAAGSKGGMDRVRRFAGNARWVDGDLFKRNLRLIAVAFAAANRHRCVASSSVK
jgi:hypothetical protein